MNAVLQQMLSHLSDEDKVIFAELSERLSAVDGDISKLQESDLKLIADMEQKYGEQIRASHDNTNNQPNTSQSPSMEEILDSPFGQHVRQILARDLVNEFPMEGDAVRFVFENKWIPVDCQEESLVETLYQKYEEDIKLCNQWRDELVAVNEDKKMAVGLAWFMVIFQLNERLNG